MSEILIALAFVVAAIVMFRLLRNEKRLRSDFTRDGRRSFESDKKEMRTGSFLHRAERGR